MRHFEEYLGDAVYVYLDDFRGVVLYTSNGIEETNTVVMEPEVLADLERWVKRVRDGGTSL